MNESAVGVGIAFVGAGMKDGLQFAVTQRRCVCVCAERGVDGRNKNSSSTGSSGCS